MKTPITTAAEGTKKVTAYFAKFSGKQRELLEQMRAEIKAISPEMTEDISYGVPVFRYKNKSAVWLAGFKNHCSLFPGGALVEKFAKQVESYTTSKGTIQFTPEKPLPAGSLEAVVRLRISEIEKFGSIYHQ